MAESVTVVASGGVPVTESPTNIGVPMTPTTGARPVTIVLSGAPSVTFISSAGILWPGGVEPSSGPAAPSLTWNSTSSDTTPDFLVDLPSGNVDPIQDAAAGDHLIIEYQLQAGGAWTQYLDYTLLAGDIVTDIISESGVTPVADGSYYFRGRLERGALIGTNSSNVAVTIAASVSNGLYVYPYLLV